MWIQKSEYILARHQTQRNPIGVPLLPPASTPHTDCVVPVPTKLLFDL